MTLRTALVVSGDTESAQRAVAEIDAAVAKSEAQLSDYERAYHKTDAAIARLAKAQAEAKREIDASNAAYKAGEISLEQYNQELLETRTGLGLIEADYRKARGELHKFSAANDNVGNSARFNRHHLTNLSYQLQDVVIAAQMGQDPLQILLQQGGQIGSIMGDAGVGVGGLTKEIVRMAMKFGPALLAIGAGTAALALLKDEVEEGFDADAIIDGLDLTGKQLEKLENRSLTFGDVIGGVWDAIVDDTQNKVTAALEAMGIDAGEVFDWIVEAAKTSMNAVYGYVTLVPRVLQESWSLIPAAAGDIMVSAANAGIAAIEGLVKGAIERINGFIQGINSLGLFELDLLGMPQFRRLENEWVGGAGRLGSAAGKAATDSFTRDFLGDAADFFTPYIGQRFSDRILGEAGDRDNSRSPGRSGGGRAGGLSDEERALKRANEETDRFIASLREEIEAIGLDEKALRQLEIQRAKESAVTSEQVAAIEELNQKREKALDLEESRQRANTLRDETDGINGSIAALEREAQAIGLVGWERERLLLKLEDQAQMDALLADLSRAKASGTQEEIDAIRAQIEALQTRNALEVQIGDAAEVHRAQSEAAERTAESYRHLQRSAAGALAEITLYGEGASDVMKRLALSIADAALQAALLGEGPLAGIFGGGSGGLIGGLLGSIFSSGGSSGGGGLAGAAASTSSGGLAGAAASVFGGGRASGGPVSPGQFYAVNERSTAPGFFFPVGPGRIESPSNDNAARTAGSSTPAPMFFDMRGAVITEDLLKQVNMIARNTAGAAVSRYDQQLPERIEEQVARYR